MSKTEVNLKVYSAIDKDLNLLHSSGHYALLYTSLLSLYENIGASLRQDNLKVITSHIIDHLWSDNFAFSDLNKLKSKSHLLHEKLAQFDHKKNSFATSTSLLKTQDFGSLMKSQDFSLLSEFSYTKGPGTFGKQKRAEKSVISPGPGDYYVKDDIVKSRSPGIFTSNVKKQSKVNRETPGPGSYSPVYHFRSR